MQPMGWLAELFETNRIIVLSVEGQVFFVMGLAIAFQSRQRSELRLARSLAWLAAFGIVHGLMIWGYLFVPIQAGFLPEPVIEGLLLLQLLLKPIGFALLFQFGVELLLGARDASDDVPHLAGRPWLRLVPVAALALWAVGTVAISTTVASGFVPASDPWLPSPQIGDAVAGVGAPLAVGDVVARALLALPGGLVVAMGLRRTVDHLGPVARGGVASAMRAAAVSFVAFALLAGLVPLAAPFPPASALNDGSVLATLGIPIEVILSIVGLAMAVAVIRSLDLFERETDRALAEARRRELLLRERERIAHDLHDGIIQSIYAAGLHLEQASGEAPEPARARIGTVMDELNRITGEIRTTIFELGPDAPQSHDAEAIVLGAASELQAQTLVQLDVESTGAHRTRLSDQQATQLHHLVTEAFSNVLRHANASRVDVRMASDGAMFRLEIADDGVGHDPTTTTRRGQHGEAQGLANMRRRAELLDGSLEIQSAPGRGTRVCLTMPLAISLRPT
jgi:signal transduction histidine kinase